jgi:hypothetical protein
MIKSYDIENLKNLKIVKMVFVLMADGCLTVMHSKLRALQSYLTVYAIRKSKRWMVRWRHRHRDVLC